MPEFTKPTSITVTADELWMAIVIPAPSNNPFIGLEVSCSKSFSILPPAILSNPDDITIIPYKKNANPPIIVNIENISILFALFVFIYTGQL